MQAAILNGLTRPKDNVQQTLNVVCPTGNCTCEPFDTLGVCHRCNNLTSQLDKIDNFGEFLQHTRGYEQVGNVTAFALPKGHFLANPDGCMANSMQCGWQDSYLMTSYGTGNRTRTNSFQDLDRLIWSMSMIYTDGGDAYDRAEAEWGKHAGEKSPYEYESEYDEDSEDYKPYTKWPNAPVSAVECAAYFCLKTIEDEVRDHTVFEKATELDGVVREYAEPSADDPFVITDSLELIEDGRDDPLYQDRLVLVRSDGGFRGEIAYHSYVSISNFFRQTLSSKWANESDVLDVVKDRIPAIEEMFNGEVQGQRSVLPAALARL